MVHWCMMNMNAALRELEPATRAARPAHRDRSVRMFDRGQKLRLGAVQKRCVMCRLQDGLLYSISS